MSIEISNLSFRFNKNQILNKLNIQINSAEFIGILGPNGCGKSTLLKNILKILQPNSGIIKINFKPLKEYSQKDLAKIIGFVPQKSDLALPLSVEDLILMGRYVSIKGIFGNYGSDDYRKVSEVMELLNLNGGVCFFSWPPQKGGGGGALSLCGGVFFLKTTPLSFFLCVCSPRAGKKYLTPSRRDWRLQKKKKNPPPLFESIIPPTQGGTMVTQ